MKLKKFVQIFLSILAFWTNLVFEVAKAIVEPLIPEKGGGRVKKLVISINNGVTCTRLWLYEMFSRWHIDRLNAA